ncbi:hypothetical protein HDU76_014089 [Blyttiomyces sp. JEL0837]|nr:hypothetical protein HDU76_014089 [Blyttiomyces sp. JEL0837]
MSDDVTSFTTVTTTVLGNKITSTNNSSLASTLPTTTTTSTTLNPNDNSNGSPNNNNNGNSNGNSDFASTIGIPVAITIFLVLLGFVVLPIVMCRWIKRNWRQDRDGYSQHDDSIHEHYDYTGPPPDDEPLPKYRPPSSRSMFSNSIISGHNRSPPRAMSMHSIRSYRSGRSSIVSNGYSHSQSGAGTPSVRTLTPIPLANTNAGSPSHSPLRDSVVTASSSSNSTALFRSKTPTPSSPLRSGTTSSSPKPVTATSPLRLTSSNPTLGGSRIGSPGPVRPPAPAASIGMTHSMKGVQDSMSDGVGMSKLAPRSLYPPSSSVVPEFDARKEEQQVGGRQDDSHASESEDRHVKFDPPGEEHGDKKDESTE